MMQFLNQPTRDLFFTGKGGVGKTSMACASAVRLADRGRRTLLVSTDPASNLDEVLGTSLANVATQIESVPNLFAMNLDPEAAAHQYRERMVGPYRGVLPEAAVASMEEQFSGSCTREIAAFDEFAKLLGDQETVRALADGDRTTLVLVTRPEPSAFEEAARTCVELQEVGIRNQHLIVNGVFTSETSSDGIAMAMQSRGDEAIASMPDSLIGLDRTTVPLTSGNLMGVESLRCVGQPAETTTNELLEAPLTNSHPDGLGSLIDELAAAGHGVILTMGKGGVGKTTVAASVAGALAQRGFDVHLSTTDPAAHVSATIKV